MSDEESLFAMTRRHVEVVLFFLLSLCCVACFLSRHDFLDVFRSGFGGRGFLEGFLMRFMPHLPVVPLVFFSPLRPAIFPLVWILFVLSDARAGFVSSPVFLSICSHFPLEPTFSFPFFAFSGGLVPIPFLSL